MVSNMIISQQMQGSVQRKFTQLANFTVPKHPGLMPGAVEGDDNLTEKLSSRRKLVTIRK